MKDLLPILIPAAFLILFSFIKSTAKKNQKPDDSPTPLPKFPPISKTLGEKPFFSYENEILYPIDDQKKTHSGGLNMDFEDFFPEIDHKNKKISKKNIATPEHQSIDNQLNNLESEINLRQAMIYFEIFRTPYVD